jgi:ankyrin repeat protein
MSPRNFWLLLCGVLVMASAAACTSELCAARLADVDLQYTDEDGNSLLHIAVWNDDLLTIQCILTAGASIEAQNNQGWTPLHAAAVDGNTGAVLALLFAGADVRGCLLNTNVRS